MYLYIFMYLIQFCIFLFCQRTVLHPTELFFYRFDYINVRNYLKNLSHHLVKGVFKYFFGGD